MQRRGQEEEAKEVSAPDEIFQCEASQHVVMWAIGEGTD